MEGIELIRHYFPQLSDQQYRQFEQLGSLYHEWNQRINVISRKDIDQLYLRHVLHSLAIAKLCSFRPGTKIIDLGTGGGFPGIPLAIVFPDAHFFLIDSTRKKLNVITAIAEEIRLTNIEVAHTRAEDFKRQTDFVVCRAVAPLSKLVGWSRNNIRPKGQNALPNGLIALKGGDLEEESQQVKRPVSIIPISQYFTEPFFEEKKVIVIEI